MINVNIKSPDSIQNYLNQAKENGGDTVLLAAGTYTLPADLYIPEGVTLQGASRDNVIIECGDYSVRVEGSDPYNTGTVTINNGDTSLVGSGTTWTSDMIGQSIYLGLDGDYFWYGIEDVVDATTITLDQPYAGPDLAGDTYTIATIIRNANINKVTIQNSIGAGVKMQYAMECMTDDIYVTGCAIGLDYDQVLFPLCVYSLLGNGTNLDWNEVSGFEIRFSVASDSTSGDGAVLLSSGNATIFDSGFSGNFGNGIGMTNCSGLTMVSVDISSNGSNGVEMIAGCSNNSFTNVNQTSNTSDGYKLTATDDSNIISGGVLSNNGGYGINIANANCDDNLIIGNQFSGNTSGAVSDTGTGTLIRSNIGVADN